MSILLPAVPMVDNHLFVPEWERRERERLDAALPPNHHGTGGGERKLRDPAARRCRRGCGYVTGSRGCQLSHGSPV